MKLLTRHLAGVDKIRQQREYKLKNRRETRMTADEQLLETEWTLNIQTVEFQDIYIGKEGVANTCDSGMVSVLYGAYDGSDDANITADEFNRRFEIT